MEGFTRVGDPALMEPGDVLVVPPKVRALHVLPETLSRHGLSSGNTHRAPNSAALVTSVFTRTRDTGCALMVGKREVAAVCPVPRRGVNTLSATSAKKRLVSFTAHPLDGDFLPVEPARERGEPDSVLGIADPLVDGVVDEFIAHATEAHWAELEPFPLYSYSATGGWDALREVARAFSGRGVLALQWAPSRLPKSGSETEPPATFRERLARRLFCHGSRYGWRSAPRELTLTVGARAADYLFAAGVEIHRPDPDMWRTLARRVLARHAKAVLREIGDMEETVGGFMRQLLGDLRKFRAFRNAWKALGADVPPQSPPGGAGRETA